MSNQENACITQDHQWRRLRGLDPGEAVPWLCCGDFNDLMFDFEKEGGNTRGLNSLAEFQHFMIQCNMVDLGSKGMEFTWSNKRVNEAHVKERLDRAVCNTAWREKHQNAQVCNLEPVGSDHSPILIHSNFLGIRCLKDFQFELNWVDHKDYSGIIDQTWDRNIEDGGGIVAAFTSNLNKVKNVLLNWSKIEFPNNQKLLGSLMEEFRNCYKGIWNEDSAIKAREIANKIEEVWVREEKYWYQRSRINWLSWGDENSRFFHNITAQHRRRNRVVCLKNDAGIWIDDHAEITSCFSNFYADLFAGSEPRNFNSVLSYVDPVVSDSDNICLAAPILDEEIKRAAFDLGSLKAPGPDGFPGLFYHHSWDVVGPQICTMVRDLFENDGALLNLNSTNLVLIPKIDSPESVGHFRPISLCNFSYKVFSKLLANRVKPVLKKVISEQQRAFVPGRMIQDNIFVVHEAFHFLKNRSGKVFEFAVKLDMNKAYDRVDWDFLEAVLYKMNFHPVWVRQVMKCISSVSFNLKLEGRTISKLTPKCGLRQGDPISPYLFIIVADVLSRMISEHVNRGDLQGIKLANACPVLSHCLFADDSVFFFRATKKNCDVFASLLDDYCLASGQRVNFEKSCVFVSPNTPVEVSSMISNSLRIPVADSPGRYLGLPVLWGRSKVEALAFVRDKVRKKVLGWNKKFLSQAGRETLIKSVANSIPTYSMSCFLYPKQSCIELNSIIAHFWWGGDETNRKIHWKAWSHLIKSKQDGGMGLKEFQNFNLALLAKQCWRIMTEPTEFWVKILKGIYFPNSSFWKAGKGSRASWAWTSLLEGRRVLQDNVLWQVGDGICINVWEDPWVSALPGFCLPELQIPTEFKNLTVSSLIENGKWSLDNMDLPRHVADSICAIDLPHFSFHDKLIWLRNANGRYSVKNGYQWLQRVDSSTTSPRPSTSTPLDKHLWSLIWSLKVQPKVRHFLWKACSKAIPTKGALWQRRCGVTPFCVRCDSYIETVEHCLLLCDWVKRVWFASPLCLKVHELNVSSFEVWLLQTLINLKHDEFAQSVVAYMCWYIWKARCTQIFEFRPPDCTWLINSVMCSVNEFWAARNFFKDQEPSRSQDVSPKFWVSPNNDSLKLNTDGAFNAATGKGGTGYILRDSEGRMVDFGCKSCTVSSAFHAEAVALHEAVFKVKDRDLGRVTVESDCLPLVNAVLDDSPCPDWHATILVSDLRFLFHIHCSFIKFAPRTCNLAADWLAKAGCKGMCPIGWDLCPPSLFLSLLSFDAEHCKQGIG